ncbi:MAG TPA: molybdopterin molybdotransferase MoeA, partial [Croceibacterium sp.]|nr:molybdopterin molybdotransferase MoeA [Croceibacterium sp.]
MATVLDMPCAAATSFDEAQNLLRGRAAPIGTEFVPLARAGGRTLAKDVFARIDSPRRDSAAMDGFAVRSADLSKGINRFRLRGQSVAGGSTPPLLQPGMAARVSTGAPMPPGADRVVVREHARVEGANVLLPDYAGKSHVRRRGDDFSRGQMLLPAGTRIDARTMVVAAAADMGSVTVWRRPTLHIMVNGDELAHPGEASSTPSRIPDSLSAALLLMAEQWGAQVTGTSRCGDRIDNLKAEAEVALCEADILVVAGGAA